MSAKAIETLTVSETNLAKALDNKKIAFNSQGVRTLNGLLKCFETILGIICFTLFLHGGDGSRISPHVGIAVLALSCSASTALLVTALLLVSYLLSPVAAGTLTKTIFEFIHSAFSSVSYGLTTLVVIITVASADEKYDTDKTVIAMIVLGLGNCVLYCISSYYSYNSFKSTQEN